MPRPPRRFTRPADVLELIGQASIETRAARSFSRMLMVSFWVNWLTRHLSLPPERGHGTRSAFQADCPLISRYVQLSR